MPSDRPKVSPPGALIVIVAPKLLYEALLPAEVVAPTEMTPGQLDGVLVPTSAPSLPADATIARVIPCASANAITC